MANDGKFLWSDIPSNFPDISMMNLTEAQLDELKKAASKVTESVTAVKHLTHRKPSGLRNITSVETPKESSPRIINLDGAGQFRLIL